MIFFFRVQPRFGGRGQSLLFGGVHNIDAAFFSEVEVQSSYEEEEDST
jgi:glutamine amidotransferase-like uncharacterized protein